VRNRLSVDSTRALLCLGNWSRAGVIKKEDIYGAALLPDVMKGNKDFLDEFDMVL
jgi:hypothetical protein